MTMRPNMTSRQSILTMEFSTRVHLLQFYGGFNFNRKPQALSAWLSLSLLFIAPVSSSEDELLK